MKIRKHASRTKSSPGSNVDALDVQSPLLTIPEACAYIKQSRSVIYERLDEFDVVKLGASRFITRASADHYIERNTRLARKAPKRRVEQVAS